MGSKSQRRKQQHAQKQRDRLEKKRKKERKQERGRQQPFLPRTVGVEGVNARHRQRLAMQVPQAWPEELAEDVAVFDDSVLAALTPESAEQVTAVRQALIDATESRGDEALKRVSTIPRSSPVSEWRLFIRGLVDWLAGQTEAAGEAWQRLAPDRRPGRMATSMMLALNPHLENVSSAAEPSSPPEPQSGAAADQAQAAAWSRFDAQQLYHAKLLRKVRFDRAALRVAEAGLKVPEESKQLLLGPTKISWLRQFIQEFQDTEPELTAALSQAAMCRAFGQTYSNLFDEARRLFPGPRHDRRNRLLEFFYFAKFSDADAKKRSERALNEYLTRDLPENELISAPLRRAIASQIHLCEARSFMEEPSQGIFDFFALPEDTKTVRKHLRAAVQAEPANESAHVTYVGWLKGKLRDQRLAKLTREALEKELAEVMQDWSQGVPGAVEPRLWLVEHWLENDQLEEARPHVEFLSGLRHDDPRVRAMPWKWQLLEAMQLCRRKALLAQVPAKLDEVEKLWPAWLPKQWLPYLKAAWMLRSGDAAACDTLRQIICENNGLAPDSLADACLMLGAAQQMRVGGDDLKKLRGALDQILKKLASLPVESLIEVGSFFWDLQRAQMLYPAYRMHGHLIGKELISRLKSGNSAARRQHDERFQKAVLWASEHRFWVSNAGYTVPEFLSAPGIQSQPHLVAAQVNFFFKLPYPWGIEKLKHFGPLLRAAAESQRDAYYRFWFANLAEKLDDAIAEQESRFGFAQNRSRRFDDPDDTFCDCPKCRAAREAAAKDRAANTTLF